MKVTKETYHSALKPPLECTPMDRFEGPNVLAFQHDIRIGLPVEFQACDVIYAEPPWRAGFEKFNARAGIHGGSYADLMAKIGAAIESARVPCYVITGRHAAYLLPSPAFRHDVLLHGYESVLMVYRAGELPPACKTTVDVINYLATRYNRLGDFCCGYGQAGGIFVRAGKQAVLCDYNGSCIGFIAQDSKNWI